MTSQKKLNRFRFLAKLNISHDSRGCTALDKCMLLQVAQSALKHKSDCAKKAQSACHYRLFSSVGANQSVFLLSLT